MTTGVNKCHLLVNYNKNVGVIFMRCNEIICGINNVVVNNYLVEVHSELSLVLDENGVLIMNNMKMLEFIPYSNILNVVNISSNNENVVYVTYKKY